MVRELEYMPRAERSQRMLMEEKLRLGVTAWAAILTQGDARQELGDVAPMLEIPAALRRRCPPFARDALRCGLRLMHAAPDSELVFCSCHGDLSATLQLLDDINRGELLSPAQFSLSVHNAAAGLLGQAVGRAANHTAIAGGDLSLSAGLTDAYARLTTRDGGSIILVFADMALPGAYQSMDEPGPDVHLAMQLFPYITGQIPHEITPKRQGGAALAMALHSGTRAVEFNPPGLVGRAP